MADTVLEVVCHDGSPEAIGLAHGTAARAQIHTCIRNYTGLFLEMANFSWEDARRRAETAFLANLQQSVPELVEEMRGIARGAEVDFLDVLVLNCRSEMALTHFQDGCTALAQVSREGGGEGAVFVAQNWDWVGEAGGNLLLMDIRRAGDGSPRIRMLTEAGLVGKFGFNDRGVGVCLNAILAGSLDPKKLPVHIAIRKALECSSVDEMIAMLNDRGVASTFNLVVGDETGNIASLECSPHGNSVIRPDEDGGMVCHTNHLYAEDSPAALKDHPSANSFERLTRIRELARRTPPSFEAMRSHLSDLDGAPTAICRSAPPGSTGMQRTETLATMIMDVRSRRAEVSLGLPSQNPPVKILTL